MFYEIKNEIVAEFIEDYCKGKVRNIVYNDGVSYFVMNFYDYKNKETDVIIANSIQELQNIFLEKTKEVSA